MKRLILLSTLLILFVSGCEKYNLKQPAYLHLNWKYYSQSTTLGELEITEGYFFANNILLSGKRVKGNDISISQDLGVQKVSFQDGGSLNMSLDVPMGDYTEFNTQIKLDAESKPMAYLKGMVTVQGMQVPLIVEWSDLSDITFNASNAFSLKKKKDYNLFIGLDVTQLFSTISQIQWDQCTVSNENGVATVVIRNSAGSPNGIIFNEISEQLAASLKLSVE